MISIVDWLYGDGGAGGDSFLRVGHVVILRVAAELALLLSIAAVTVLLPVKGRHPETGCPHPAVLEIESRCCRHVASCTKQT